MPHINNLIDVNNFVQIIYNSHTRQLYEYLCHFRICKMGSRIICTGLNRCVNNYCAKIVQNCAPSQRIHAIGAKQHVDFQCKLSRILLYSSDIPKKCWQCNYPFKSELFCQKCKTLQKPPEQLDYFEILGVEKHYDVELKEIQRKYRELQSSLHPDKFGNKTQKELEYSENISSLLNRAYSTLSHPLDRGLYLLKLKNLSIPEGATNLDPEFLMEIMERNEQIENSNNNKDKVVALVADNKTILETLTKEISEAFRNDNIEKARLLLIKMKYYASIEARLKQLKRDLGIIE